MHNITSKMVLNYCIPVSIGCLWYDLILLSYHTLYITLVLHSQQKRPMLFIIKCKLKICISILKQSIKNEMNLHNTYYCFNVRQSYSGCSPPIGDKFTVLFDFLNYLFKLFCEVTNFTFLQKIFQLKQRKLHLK